MALVVRCSILMWLAVLLMPFAAMADTPQLKTESESRVAAEEVHGDSSRTRAQWRLIERRLNALGFAAGLSDGIPDDKTRAGIRAFQEKYHLNQTGKLDVTTERALFADQVDVEKKRAARQAATREARAATTRNRSRVLGTPGQGSSEVIAGLEGRWEGAYFCKQEIGEAELTFSIDGGDYAAVWVVNNDRQVHTTKILDYRPDGGLGFEIQRRRGQMGIYSLHGEDVERIAEEAAFISVGMGGLGSDCKGMLMYRFVPIAGFGGDYASATGLHAACDIMERQWLADPGQEETAARVLKTELPRLLASYNPKAASGAGIYSGGRFTTTFGLQPDELSDTQRKDLRTQIRMCALLTDERQRDVFQSAFFVPGALARSIRGTIAMFWKPQLDVPLVAPLETLADRERAGRTALDNIRAVVDELLALSDSDSVRSIALQRGIFTHDVSPSDLKVVLDPLIEHLKGLGRQRYANIRMAIGQLDVPYDAIPKTAAPLFRQLERGEAVSLDASTMQYLAGMALFLVRECKLPAETAQRREATDFIMSAFRRASLGSNYDSMKLGMTLSDILASRLSLESGFATASYRGCNDRFNGQMASLIGTGLATNRSDEAELSLFIRSCAVEFDLQRCDCLQSVLQSIHPDIGRREYHRGLIASTIKSNVLIGASIVGQCKIGDY